MERLIIIDGNAIIHRAYHALPPMTTKDGHLVNAVYGFASMLLKVWKDLRPTHIAVTFDVAGGSTARLEKFKAYKATRVKADQELYDQIPTVHDLVRVFDLPIYEKKGYEADDVIGTIVEQVESRKSKVESDKLEVFIVTGDMDTLQLVKDGVKVYTLRKGLSDVVVYDAAAVTQRYGFGPELMVDYKALRGDASDNIPGVPGIGEKIGSELIQKVGGLEEIYKQLRTPNSELRTKFKDGIIKKLEAGKESALMSKSLAAIDCDVPDLRFKLEDCRLKDFDRAKVAKLFQKLEFVSLLKRVPGKGGEIEAEEKKSKAPRRLPKQELKFSEIKTSAEAIRLIKLVQEKKSFAGRAITEGGDLFTSHLTGLVLVVGRETFYAKDEAVKTCLKLFEEKDIELVGHNLKQLFKIMAREKVVVKNTLFDVMVASYLLNPGSRAHDMGSVVLKILGKELKVGSGQESLFGLDAKTLAVELELISEAGEKLRHELVKVDNLGLFSNVEMPLIPVLAEMELNGVAVDEKKLAELSRRVAGEIKKVSEKIYRLAGQEFNISSPLQLREILFEKLDIPVEGIKRGKTGLSTSAEQLEKMRGLHPIIDEIEIHRELSKLQNTYIDVIPTLINKTTGRIHTTFNQVVTATGRLSSSDPNLQNIPIRTALGREVREAFIAEPGNVLVSADYSQIELRIVASLAEDKKMIEIFERGEDIHRATAAAINNVPLDKVTKEMRRAAKEVNFGILYGMGTYGLSWRAEISHAEAKAFIEKYFREFSGVKKYIDRTLEFTKKEGYCETLFGRRRYLPELNSKNFQLRSAAERMAINHPVQGTAADLMKMGMIEVYGRVKSQKSKVKSDKIKMILQVHDELVLEVEKSLADEVGKIVKEVMENVAKLRVPIEAHVSIVKNWGEKN